MSVFYQCRFCGICFSFQRYFCHGRIVSNSLRRFGIGSVSQVRIQKEEILSPRIFEKKIHESARVERSAERWRRAKERSDEAKSTTKRREKGEGEKRLSQKHDKRACEGRGREATEPKARPKDVRMPASILIRVYESEGREERNDSNHEHNAMR